MAIHQGTLLAALLLAALTTACNNPGAPRLSLDRIQIPADGYSTATLSIVQPTGNPTVTVSNQHVAQVTERSPSQAILRAGINPGRVTIRVVQPGSAAAEINLQTLPFLRDDAQDGTPDFLRLQDERDQLQFRRAFTRLAETQYFEPPASRPAEVKDCSSLIRYAYREALRTAAAKYQYPYTPLGASLFRVQPGPFQAADLTSGAFAQFADAKTLRRFNSYPVGRILSAAMPGDLLFFQQPAGPEQYHSMIYLGQSQLQNDGRTYVLYHTGPSGSDPGEIRRLTAAELMHFPRAEWRPLISNPRFLGVYRWNILGARSPIS